VIAPELARTGPGTVWPFGGRIEGAAVAGLERSTMGEESGAFALVIGGGSGIGAALADRYRAAGTTTVVWDVAGERDVTCDVTEPDGVDEAVGATTLRWGVPTWVTVTAGIGHFGTLMDAAPDDFDRVMRVNTRGPWLCMRAWVAAMLERNVPGSFVAVSSVSARLVDPGMGLYCASKAALSMLVKVAAAEWGPLGLRVNGVGPGVTRTPMLGHGVAATVEGSPWLAGVANRTPLGRLGEAVDVADTVVALHGMDWVTGQVLECDGGLALHSPIESLAVVGSGRTRG
jgi:NAD(P)-dependent dehydrogenase (short-subunit alcohol dehydrogenase family)